MRLGTEGLMTPRPAALKRAFCPPGLVGSSSPLPQLVCLRGPRCAPQRLCPTSSLPEAYLPFKTKCKGNTLF